MDRVGPGQEHRRPPSSPGGSVSEPATRPLALVTGASSGIGRELAKQFAEHGFDLIVAAEDVELDDATETLRGLGGAVAPVSVDLRRRRTSSASSPPTADPAGRWTLPRSTPVSATAGPSSRPTST